MRLYLTILVLLGCISAMAKKAIPVPPDTSSQKQSALSLVRTINTVEFTYQSKTGHYGDFNQLVTANLLKQGSMRLPDGVEFATTNPQEPVPGLHLNLSPAPDGRSYQVAVLSKPSDTEAWGFYSNQDAVIYNMLPIK
jgi:hypothetical protein